MKILFQCLLSNEPPDIGKGKMATSNDCFLIDRIYTEIRSSCNAFLDLHSWWSSNDPISPTCPLPVLHLIRPQFVNNSEISVDFLHI